MSPRILPRTRYAALHGARIVAGDAATKASDVYALGVILYEIATGVGPGTHPAPPSACVPGLDSRWDRAVMACLSPLAADRPEASEVQSRLEQEPRSKTPLVAAGIILALAGIGATIPGVRGAVMLRLYPPNVRLAILPLDAAPEDAVTGGGALQEATERIRRLQGASATLVVIPPNEPLIQGIHDPVQAFEILHATHALQTSLRREGDQWSVRGAIFDLEAKVQVGWFSATYTSAKLTNLPVALAGAVSAALRLRGVSGAEALNPAAAGAYFRGLYYLRRDRSFEQAIPPFQEAARLDGRSALPPAELAEAQILKYQALAGPPVAG